MKKLIRIFNYLTICIGNNNAIPTSALDLCFWVKAEYPSLTGQQLLMITAALIRSTSTMYERNPIAKESLNNAVNDLLSNRNKQ
ncbi:hypothetical protein [Brunnivagina elsteri]|uniref:hypothetical protein n=1 Tax=Brunnivagina elsteri TaxID=1247191 RepID=UPI0011778A59|nr:hypothetical protein [Calothrix elsteri]